MEFETYHGFLRGAWFQHTFLQVQTQVIGSKSEEATFLIVSLFIWCCLQKRFVMFVQYPQWNFLLYWIWAMFLDLMNFLNMPSQDTLICTLSRIWDHNFIQPGIKLVQLQCKTLIQNSCCCSYSKILFQPRRQHWESFQRVTQNICETTENQS